MAIHTATRPDTGNVIGAPAPSRTARAFARAFRLAVRCTPWGRYRAIVAPYWLSLVIAATAGTTHRRGGGLFLVAAVGFLLAAIFWSGPALVARLRQRRGSRVEAGSTRSGAWLDRTPERVYAVAVTVLATAMVGVVARAGWSSTIGWVWMGCTVAAGLPWQWHYQWWLRGPSTAARSRIAAAWPECQERIPQLKGAALGPDVGEGDVERHLVTVPAGKEATSILGLGGAIGGVVDAVAGTVTVTRGDDDEELTDRQAWVTLAARQKLGLAQVFPGPDLDREGTFLVANSTGGSVHGVAHDKDGVKHAIGIGATGSGKGSLHSLHMINRIETGWYVPLLLEGKGGTSVHGAIQDACHAVARTPEEWEMLANGVWRAMQVRKRIFGDRRYTRYRIWDMWREFPAVYLSMDEMPALARSLSGQAKRNLLEIGEQGRSLGYGLGGFGQSSRGDMIPGGTPMRALLTGGGTAWYGRAGDGGRDRVVRIGDREYDLTRFPAGAGWGYVAGGALAGKAVVTARALWVPDDPDERDDLDGWVPSKPLPQLPDAELEALGWDPGSLGGAAPVVSIESARSAAAEQPAAGESAGGAGDPTAEDAIIRILTDAAGAGEVELTMGEITRRTADMPWRAGRPYDRSTIRERLPQMVGRVVQGERGWRLAA